MLSVDNEDVTILSSSGQYGDIPGGVTSDLAGFTIQASSGLHMGDSLILDLRLEANQGIYVKTVSYPLIVGVDIAEEPETCELSLEAPLVPFREYLNVKLAIPCIGPVELDLYDCTGRKVRTFINRPAYPSGICEYSFTAVDDYGKHLGTGVYFLKLTTESGDVSQKVIHLR
jgi:hypothetical protein